VRFVRLDEAPPHVADPRGIRRRIDRPKFDKPLELKRNDRRNRPFSLVGATTVAEFVVASIFRLLLLLLLVNWIPIVLHESLHCALDKILGGLDLEIRDHGTGVSIDDKNAHNNKDRRGSTGEAEVRRLIDRKEDTLKTKDTHILTILGDIQIVRTQFQFL
jgi:hypothetical protein